MLYRLSSRCFLSCRQATGRLLLVDPSFDHLPLSRRSATGTVHIFCFRDQLAAHLVKQTVELLPLRLSQSIDLCNVDSADHGVIVRHGITSPRHDEILPSIGRYDLQRLPLAEEFDLADGNQFEAAKLAPEHRNNALLPQCDFAPGQVAIPLAAAANDLPPILEGYTLFKSPSRLDDRRHFDLEQLFEPCRESQANAFDVLTEPGRVRAGHGEAIKAHGHADFASGRAVHCASTAFIATAGPAV